MCNLPHASWAEVYDVAYQEAFGNVYHALTDATIELVRNRVDPPATIVDFGAGTGRLAIPLSERGYRVTAVEQCQEMLDQLQMKDGHGLITLACSTMQDFEADEEFDFALCVFNVIIYLLDDEALQHALSSAYSALKPNGSLLLDIASEQLFQGFSFGNGVIERRVTVTPVNNGLYLYKEDLRVREPDGGVRRYSDEFQIRYWPKEVVLNASEGVGFSRHENVTRHVPYAAGADYWIMKK